MSLEREHSSALAPLAIFCYNRPKLLKQTIEAVLKNDLAQHTEVYFFIDGIKSEADISANDEVKALVSGVCGFLKKYVIEREKNFGLKQNITTGISNLLKKYESVIVLEDDILTSKCFLQFMNEALQMYAGDDRVCQISGYSYIGKYFAESESRQYYFLKGGDCLAWATWKESWAIYSDDSTSLLADIQKAKRLYEFDRCGNDKCSVMLRENIWRQHSWAINWYASTFLKGALTLYPIDSMAIHVTDATELGTNYKPKYQDPLAVEMCHQYEPLRPRPGDVDSDGEHFHHLFLQQYRRSRSRGIRNWMRKLIKRLVSGFGRWRR